MRAIILAGGYARRMWPLTSDFPKSLLRIGKRPAIEYIVDKILEINIAKTLIATNLKFEKHFRAWLDEKKLSKIEIVVEKSTSNKNKLGATHALSELVPQLPADDYLIVAGDNIFTASLKGMLDFYNRVMKPIVAIYDVNDLDQVRRASTVTLDTDMRIINFEEKPPHPVRWIIGACIYILPYETLLKTKEYIDAGGKNDEPGNFIAWLCKKETVYGFRLGGLIWDIGSIEEYKRTQREFPGQLST